MSASQAADAGAGAGAGDDQVVIALEAYQVDLPAGVGRVVSAGPRAQGLLDRRVLVGPIDPCGECDVCRRGGAAVCPLARRRDAFDGAPVTAAGRWVVPLGDGLVIDGATAAAVAGDVALAYTLYARTGVAPRDPVVVVGASPIARFLVEILRAKGIAPLVVTAATEDPRASLATAFAAQSLGTKPWRVLCAAPDATALAAQLAGPRATLTLLAGAGPGPDPHLPGELLAREVTIIGVAGAHPDLVVEAAAMCVKGEVDLVAGTVILDEASAPGSAAPGRSPDSSSDAAPRTRIRVVAP